MYDVVLFFGLPRLQFHSLFGNIMAPLYLSLLLITSYAYAWKNKLVSKGIVGAGVAISLSEGALNQQLASIGTGVALSSLTPSPALAAEYRSEKAVKQVVRVYHSLQNIYDDIEKNGADASSVRKQVNLVERNYELRDNIRKALDDIEGMKTRDDAYSHGLQCIEDLALISEYYEDAIDDATGKKTPARETLMIAEKALQASRDELAKFLSYVPYGKSTIEQIKKEEFAYK